MHQIRGELRWARPRTKPSFASGRPRRTGAKAKGLAYESQVKNVLGNAVSGQWWEAEDAAGAFICQTDFVLKGPGGTLVVVEAKYTWTLEGHRQISQLYRPVIEKATGRRVYGVVVCKKLVAGSGASIYGTLMEALEGAIAGVPMPVWHWLGP